MAEKKEKIPLTICILRLSALGDICHAIAMVQHIQRYMPEARITWVTGKAEASLLRYLPAIEIVEFNKNNGLVGYLQLYRKLKGRRFDVLLHMQVAIRASLASLCIKAKRRVGFDRARAREGQWLFTNEQISAQPQPHVLDGFMAFSHSLGLPHADPQWSIPINKSALKWVENAIAKKRYVVLSASASNAERNWHADAYCQLADYITQLGFTVVLTASAREDEVAIARKISKRCKRNIINFAGSTNLHELMALIQGASFVVSPDSGPVHMAVCLNTPAVGIYAHSNPLRTGPYHFRQYTVSHYEKNVLAQYGKPSSQLRWGIRAKGNHLMHEITFEEVKHKVDLLIQRELRAQMKSII